MNLNSVEMLLLLLLLSTICYRTFGAAGDTCLGIPGACDLSLDEVTLPGAHNAGAGFDGILKYHTSLGAVPALSCAYRNQYATAYEMLNAGIRYFDIDLCFVDDSTYGRGLWACHKGAYGGKMAKFFDDVNKWMNESRNRNEIVVLHFNGDYAKGEETKIEKALLNELKFRWDPKFKDGRVTMQEGWWMKIGVSVKSNQRIYVFVHDNLKTNSQDKFLLQHNYVGFTWKSMGYIGSDGCKKLADELIKNCKTQSKFHYFVRLDLTMAWGLCLDDLAQKCNRHIKYATDKCYYNIRSTKYGNANTINFIVTDYAHQHPGSDAVKVAKETTLRYIKEKAQNKV